MEGKVIPSLWSEQKEDAVLGYNSAPFSVLLLTCNPDLSNDLLICYLSIVAFSLLFPCIFFRLEHIKTVMMKDSKIGKNQKYK